MKTVRTIRTVEKMISVCSWLVLMLFLTGTVFAVEPDKDDLAIFGTRQVRITNPCDPEVPAPQAADPNCATVHPDANWSYDISWFDPATKMYYLADRDNFGIDIVDTTNDTVVSVARGGFVGVQPGSNTSGPNGVLVTTKPHQIYAGDGNSTVKVFRLNVLGDTATFLTSVKTGDANHIGVKRADELAYDPDDQLVLVANDDPTELFLTFISVDPNPANIKVKGVVDLKSNCPVGGCATTGIEQPVYDHGTHLFYVAVPQTTGHTNGEILVVDPKTMKAVAAFGLTDVNNSPIPCFPHGLALGPNQQLLVGCSADTDDVAFPNGHPLVSIIISALDGSLVRQFNKVGGSDEVWYNPGDNTYYLAASNWQLNKDKVGFVCPTVNPPANECPTTAAPVLGIIDAGSDADGPQFIQNIKTVAGAHSVAAAFIHVCDVHHGKQDERGKREDDRCDQNGVVNKAYVPFRVVPASGETGGIAVIGRVP